MHLTLKLVNGEILEESVESNVCIIGRSAKCTVVVPHDGMSRQHCQIDVVDGEYFITDLGSTNGVYIDGQRIEANQKTPYQTFLTLSFGAVQSLIIENEEPAGGSLNVSSSSRRESIREASSGVTSTTRTRVMTDQNKTTPTGSAQANWKPKSAVKDKDNSKTQMMMTYIFIAIILAGAVWWYSQKEDVANPDVPVIIEDKPVKEPPAKPYESF